MRRARAHIGFADGPLRSRSRALADAPMHCSHTSVSGRHCLLPRYPLVEPRSAESHSAISPSIRSVLTDVPSPKNRNDFCCCSIGSATHEPRKESSAPRPVNLRMAAHNWSTIEIQKGFTRLILLDHKHFGGTTDVSTTKVVRGLPANAKATLLTLTTARWPFRHYRCRPARNRGNFSATAPASSR